MPSALHTSLSITHTKIPHSCCSSSVFQQGCPPQGWHHPPTLLLLACRDANFHILKFKHSTSHLDARQSAGEETGPSPFSTFPSASPCLLIHECQTSLNLSPGASKGFGLLFSLYLRRLKPAIALSPPSTTAKELSYLCRCFTFPASFFHNPLIHGFGFRQAVTHN